MLKVSSGGCFPAFVFVLVPQKLEVVLLLPFALEEEEKLRNKRAG